MLGAREKKKERDGWIVLFFSEEEIGCLCFLSHVLRKKTRERKSEGTPHKHQTSRDDDDDDD